MAIVVSGIGLTTPLGSSREKTWKALIDGKSGVRREPHGLEARIYDFSPNGARSRMGDFALLAAREALAHAGFSAKDVFEKIIGCAISQSKPVVAERLINTPPSLPTSWGGTVSGNLSQHSSNSSSENFNQHFSNSSPGNFNQHFSDSSSRSAEIGSSPRSGEVRWGMDRLDASLLLASFTGYSAEALVHREFNLNGPTSNIVAACASGVASISVGLHFLLSGQCDAALVGASESSLNSFYRSGFEQMGVLASEAAKPFDRDRNGFVMGEGAAVLLIETEESARARGHKPLAFIDNVVLRQSADDAVRFDSKGGAIARLIQTATRGERPGYINAHGTGTRFNDETEARAIQQALGEQTASVPVSSTKAATGHLLGAAGAVEAAISVLALRDQVVPPTLNLKNVDAACELNHVKGEGKKGFLSSALSLSYGFGGQMGAVFFRNPT